MTFISPRRGISALAAVLVTAMFIMPSGTALAAEQTPPQPTGSQPQATLSPEPASKEDPEQEDVVVETPESTKIQGSAVETSQPGASEVVEQSNKAAAADDTLEQPVAQTTDVTLAHEGHPLTCGSGYVYSLHWAGHINEINPSGNRSQRGSFGGGNDYNGLGIGAHGAPIYGYQRTSSAGHGLQIFRWNGPGAQPVQVANYQHDLNGAMVAGAVNLNTGDYYFGGFEPNAGRYHFRVWRYEPDVNTVRYIGDANTGIRPDQRPGAEGDMAFNANGDLFFLIGEGNQASLGTVSADALRGATGGELQTSMTEIKGLTDGPKGGDINGIAFGADGSLYLGTTKDLYQYNPTTWQKLGVRRNALINSTDLASCEATNTPVPVTQLTLRKAFDTSYGAPENTEDWTLTATPSGGKVIEFDHGQTKNVEAGQYTIAELFGDDKVAPGAAGYELAEITCTTDGEKNPVRHGQVTLQDRTVTECILRNTDQPGSVVWQKTNTDGDHLAGSEWKLTGPDAFGDNGELIVTDNGNQDADKRDGYFKVENLTWGDYELQELAAPEGYQLSDEAFDFTISGADRDYVFSEAFENGAIPTLTLHKGFHTQFGAPEDPADWHLFATVGEQELAFDHGEPQRVQPGTYTLSESFGPEAQEAEDAGYTLQEIVCSVDGGETQVLEGSLTIESDTATECTLISADLPGAVVWEKTNAHGTPLADAEWKLSGPDGERAVVDNGDYDVVETAGTIRVEGLHWGDYTLQEVKAPAGFVLATETAQFTITGAQREYTFDEAFINEPLQPGTLPLTGALSGKWPLIGAASLALMVLTGLAGTLRRRTH